MSPFLALLQAGSGPAGASTRQAAGDAVQETWRLMDLPALWVVVLILIPGALGVAYLAYWRESISTRSVLVIFTSSCRRSTRSTTKVIAWFG